MTVFLGTTRRLQGKTLPGDAERDQWLAAMLANAEPPLLSDDGSTERGTYEDWIGWAVGDNRRGWPGALGNGHDTWATEVKPEMSVQQLYEREVLSIEPKPLARPELRPTTEAPTNLGGYRKITSR